MLGTVAALRIKREAELQARVAQAEDEARHKQVWDTEMPELSTGDEEMKDDMIVLGDLTINEEKKEQPPQQVTQVVEKEATGSLGKTLATLAVGALLPGAGFLGAMVYEGMMGDNDNTVVVGDSMDDTDTDTSVDLKIQKEKVN